MNICTPAMASAGARVLRAHNVRPGDWDKGAARLAWEAMERRRLHDEALARINAIKRRAAANSPWNGPPLTVPDEVPSTPQGPQCRPIG